MNLKKTLLKNGGAGALGKMSLFLVRFAQVPILLGSLGVTEYAGWLLISSLPSWLTLTNLGFGNACANAMSMAVAEGDLPKARRIYSTAIAFFCALAGAGTILIGCLAFYIPWERVAGMDTCRHQEVATACSLLGGAVLISFLGEAFYGRFRAGRKAHQAMLFGSLRPWLDILILLGALRVSHRFDWLALSTVTGTGIYLVTLHWLSSRAVPELAFDRRNIQLADFRALIGKGVAFQLFPIGNALLFQGNLLLVQHVLGPSAVALFGTARTLVRSVNQLMELINQTIWPELTHLLGQGDMHTAARLHRIGVTTSVALALLSALFLGVFGSLFFHWWTGNALTLQPHLLWLFLSPIPFNALWFTSSVVHAACNRHEKLAVYYTVACAFSNLACWGLASALGLEGAAVSTLIVDIVLIPYVFSRSLEMTGDTWADFRCWLMRRSIASRAS